MMLKFLLKGKRPEITNTILKKRNKIGLSDLKTYNKATVNKWLKYWWKNKHIKQQNGIECPEIDPHKYCLWKRGKDNLMKQGYSFQQRKENIEKLDILKLKYALQKTFLREWEAENIYRIHIWKYQE